MPKYLPVTLVQDGDSHWYVIPVEMFERFEIDVDNEDIVDSGDFDDKWGSYRTGGDLNNIKLYATKEDLDNL